MVILLRQVLQVLYIPTYLLLNIWSSTYMDPLIPVGSESRMGLMATIKHVALWTPPCGTPVVVVWFLDKVFPIFTFIVHSLR